MAATKIVLEARAGDDLTDTLENVWILSFTTSVSESNFLRIGRKLFNALHDQTRRLAAGGSCSIDPMVPSGL